MARKPSPWYWPERNGWFTILNGQRLSLGEHPGDSPPQKRKGKCVVPASIDKQFHSLLSSPATRTVPQSSSGYSLSELLDKFLDWTQKNKATRTFEWYRDHLQGFLNHLAKPIAASELRPFHVIEWIDKHPNWSPAYRRGAIVAVQRPFNWAEELGYIPSNPVKKIKKPQPQRRETHVTPDDFTELIGHYPDGDPFRDLLLFSWHTGCRPQEASQIEPRHVHLETECVVIPKDEAKGKRRGRVIILQGPALEIAQRLMEEGRSGKLFVNEDGKTWKRFAIANRFDRLHLSIGIGKLKELGIEVEPLPRFNRRKFPDAAKLAAGASAAKVTTEFSCSDDSSLGLRAMIGVLSKFEF